ncbi:hypothetical protein GLYMA_17G191766v4 [Glycine max]|nr:hypothetical protein GLYMA_17G191766v4 [Glycine max]
MLMLHSLFLSGILFQDITTLLLDTKAFKETIDLFVERHRDQNINVVVGTLRSHTSILSIISCLCSNAHFSSNEFVFPIFCIYLRVSSHDLLFASCSQLIYCKIGYSEGVVVI